ncbi:MAG: hypothetical protein GY754_23685 [bacterium]|nr:hypothetical protein [bacterium]MCP4133993.1 hypothetical protein [bacterium]
MRFKRLLVLLFFIAAVVVSGAVSGPVLFAQDDIEIAPPPRAKDKDKDKKDKEDKEDKEDKDKSAKKSDGDYPAFDLKGSALVGGVTVDEKNYQQVGGRLELAIYKFGVGLDIQVLLDEEGDIRKEDWNNFNAYLDKIYYLSWARKGAPFYIRVGGIEDTYLGYGIIVDGYSNMIEYPTYKRMGMEMSFDTSGLGGELIINDFKELWQGSNPSLFVGGRLSYKIISRLSIGASIASDLNEYKGLRDTDGDGIPDEIDEYPYDSRYTTEQGYYLARGISAANIADLVAKGLISDTDLTGFTNLSDRTSRSTIWGADIGFNIIKSKFVTWDVYTQFAHIINTKGWGFTAPGSKLRLGIFTFTAEYKQSSDKFVFGYYNNTYELERARIVNNTTQTKVQTLEDISGMKGFFAGFGFNFWDYVSASITYQHLLAGDESSKTVKGELQLKDKLIPKIAKARAYYIRNNAEQVFTWKTSGTIMGAVLGVSLVEGASIDFNYMLTYQDKDGDGKINADDETIRTISVSASSLF